MRRVENGFTLIEMLITIAIIAILASIALPSFKQAIINTRMKQAADAIKTALEQARAESFISQKTVHVNVNNNAIVTTTTDGTGTTVTKTQNFDKNIVVNPQSSVRQGVYFNKSIPQTSNGNPLGQSNTGYVLCYRDEVSNKYTISLKGYNTIELQRSNGGCS